MRVYVERLAAFGRRTRHLVLLSALEAMERADVDLLPVIDGDQFIGVVTTDEVLRLDEILERGEEAE